MFFPFLVILPGMIAGVVSISKVQDPAPTRMEAVSERQAQSVFRGGKGIIPPKYDSEGNPVLRNGQAVLDYDLATPMMLIRFFPSGLLGIGLCALIASFMSGMAGNTTAFNTVWTYDIYQGYFNKTASDQHYLWMGRAATVFGLALSVLAAYVAKEFNNIMDVLQLVFAFVNAPLFATFMLGMFWKRATGHGAFCGLLGGMLAAAVHNGLTLPAGATPGLKGGFLGSVLHGYPSEMAQNFWTAIFAWVSCFAITIIVSLCTRPRPDVELKGLVYSLTPKPKDEGLTWYQKPGMLAVVILVVMIALNLVFW
jgi:SSS family solute:Na+ symporter